MKQTLRNVFFVAMLLAGRPVMAQTSVGVKPDPDRGLYAIWYEQTPKLLDLPFIKGGQVVLQWGQLETGKGVYNFKVLDDALEKMQRLGRKATIQVNGNTKPAYLYSEIAMNPKKLSPQIRDPQGGTIQFWDPLYLKYYVAFLEAYGKHLRTSTYKSTVLAVRMNFNPMGTEHYFQEVGSPLYKYTDADKDFNNYKPAPNGHRYAQSFTDELMAGYMKEVVETYLKYFTPDIKVLARYELLLPGHEADATVRNALEAGKLGLFMTNSEARHAHNFKEQIFMDYCRTGKALGYSEQFSDSEGHHAGSMMNFPQWPSAWNYWRILGDLDRGISYLAIYGEDLSKDGEPEYHAAFTFAKKYVGYHASPALAPGAWIALRDTGIIPKALSKSGPVENISFLMKELKPAGKMETGIGPKDQRYGAWARTITGKESLQFRLNDAFAQSISGKPAQLHIIYLDNDTKPFTVSWYQDKKLMSKTIAATGTKRWKDVYVDIHFGRPGGDAAAADILINAPDGAAFHFIEVTRAK